ncbi:hypothetical protein NXX20_10590 [Bacteroides stercoris]|nr:hypothetical protein [Bacteroides stercoris]
MANIIKVTATDGTPLEFYDEVKSSGGMKDCYFSTDKKYVCLVFREAKHNNPSQTAIVLKQFVDFIRKESLKKQVANIGNSYSFGQNMYSFGITKLE